MRSEDLYNNPVQIAAYVAAVNSNLDGEFVKTCGDELIKQGAVILAFETGQEYQVTQLDADELTVNLELSLLHSTLFFRNTLTHSKNE